MIFIVIYSGITVEQLTTFINNFIDLSAEASPWLLLGLLIAGLMKAWVPNKILSKHLGKGKSAIVKAALIGAPLPLCSCGVIPVATELRRSGASAPATASFLVATPETGIDSVSVSYALLGPVFAIYRPFAAIMSAIITGIFVSSIKEQEIKSSTEDVKQNNSSCCASKESSQASLKTKNKAKVSTCCSATPSIEEAVKASSCCSSNTAVITEASTISPSVFARFIEKTKAGVYYAATKLIDDIIIWLAIGLIFAAIIRTFLPQEFLLSYGSGLPAMLIMIAISIPMYICATASTPIAAGFIMAGLSPGTALVFMMAGPATNISTLGVIKNEMGGAVLTRYLLGVAISAISFASLLDFALNYYQINIGEQMQHSHELLPYWFGITCAALIALLAIKPLRKRVL